MIEKISVTQLINADNERVWTAISGIGGLDRWFPVIAGCTLEGQGVGAMRTLTLADGKLMKDVVEEIDQATKRFRYQRIESPFAVDDYHGIVEIRSADNHKTEVIWTVELTSQSTVPDELAAFISQALTDGIRGLEQDLQHQPA